MPSSSSPRLLALGAVTAVLLTTAAARAELATCVEVAAPAGEDEAVGRLIRSEIDRHPTHRAATKDCQTFRSIEVIDLKKEKWITGRVDSAVPHREPIGSDGVAAAIERLLTVVLHNDPLVLRGPESQTWLAQQKRQLERRSLTHFGLEVFELGSLLGTDLATIPGVALSVRREVSALYVGARVGGALSPIRRPDALRLRAEVDAQVELALYAAPSADISLFAGALLGLVYQRFEGPAPFDGADATGAAVNTGMSIALRAGVEALRTSNVRAMAFLMLQAPAFVSRDPDHGVVDAWVPSASLGAGVLF